MCQAWWASRAPAGLVRATRARTFLGGSLELKGSREEAGAWVAGGALPSSPLHARRSDSLEVQRVPQHLFVQFSAARARRVHGSAPRGSAQRSSQAWKRRVQRAPSALVHAGFQASPTRVKLKCPACAAAISRLSAFRVFPDSCLQLRKLERKGQSLDGARRKLQAGGSGPSQRQVRACSLPRMDFPAVSMRVRALRFSKYAQKRRVMVFTHALPRACTTNSRLCAAVCGSSALWILDLHMTAVGFEPTQLALVELESTPLDHSGKLSWGEARIKVAPAHYWRQHGKMWDLNPRSLR